MFRSKGFTITFIILSVMITALLGVFIYLVSGAGKGSLEKELEEIAEAQYQEALESTEDGSSESTTPTETEKETTTAETTTTKAAETTEAIDTEIRALKPGEPHTYPLIHEIIDEAGVLTIVRPGDVGEGLVFHVQPQFDDAHSEGNVVYTNGSFDTSGKVFILEQDKPFLMYYTVDGYFVTSSPVYVSYKSRVGTTIAKEEAKVGSYGYNEDAGIVCVVYCEDGDHVAFSLFDYDKDQDKLTPVLEYIIGAYTADGTARFEYHGSDGKTHLGSLVLSGVSDSDVFTRQAHFVFDKESPIRFKAGTVEELFLHY